MELALCPWSFPNIHDLVGLGPTLHNEPQTSWGHLFSTKLYRALREAKFLQNYAGQFPDLLALLIKNILHPGGQSNDFCPGWYNSGLNSRAVIFSMPLSEELVQLVLKKPSTTNVLSLEIFTIILLLHTTKRKGYYSEFWEFFLYDLDTSPSSHACFGKIFLQSVTCHLTLLTIFFEEWCSFLKTF